MISVPMPCSSFRCADPTPGLPKFGNITVRVGNTWMANPESRADNRQIRDTVAAALAVRNDGSVATRSNTTESRSEAPTCGHSFPAAAVF